MLAAFSDLETVGDGPGDQSYQSDIENNWRGQQYLLHGKRVDQCNAREKLADEGDTPQDGDGVAHFTERWIMPEGVELDEFRRVATSRKMFADIEHERFGQEQ